MTGWLIIVLVALLLGAGVWAIRIIRRARRERSMLRSEQPPPWWGKR